jgi:hypothetical protein
MTRLAIDHLPMPLGSIAFYSLECWNVANKTKRNKASQQPKTEMNSFRISQLLIAVFLKNHQFFHNKEKLELLNCHKSPFVDRFGHF